MFKFSSAHSLLILIKHRFAQRKHSFMEISMPVESIENFEWQSVDKIIWCVRRLIVIDIVFILLNKACSSNRCEVYEWPIVMRMW